MPEIINQNRVNAKLLEFDEKMDGAINAATKIMKVKSDAEKIANDLQLTGEKSSKILDDLKDIYGDWNILKSKIDKPITEIKTVRDQIVNELDAVQKRLNSIVGDAASNLRTELQDSLDDHFNYVEESKESLKIAKAAQNACQMYASKLEELLRAAHNEFENDFTKKYRIIFEEVGKHTEGLQLSNKQSTEALRLEVFSKLDEFQNITKEIVNQQLTVFLTKQNALVQNFGQQVDGFQRSLTAEKGHIEQMERQVADMVTKIESTAKWYSECSNRQDAEIVKLRERDTEVTKLKERLDRTLELLQNTGTFFSGGKFKGI